MFKVNDQSMKTGSASPQLDLQQAVLQSNLLFFAVGQ
jgi:hypothetical protein